jgi:hypothetical protein
MRDTINGEEDECKMKRFTVLDVFKLLDEVHPSHASTPPSDFGDTGM